MSHTNSTTNYGLPEFLSSDKPAWMADINTAFATIDTQMKANADSASNANTDIGTMGLNFAPGYSNASTYDVGNIVMYDKRLYICDIAVTVPEAFDSAKWSYYRVSDVGETANASADLLGNTDISSVGDGTVTGAVSTLNSTLSNPTTSFTVIGTTDANGVLVSTDDYSDGLITAIAVYGGRSYYAIPRNSTGNKFIFQVFDDGFVKLANVNVTVYCKKLNL